MDYRVTSINYSDQLARDQLTVSRLAKKDMEKGKFSRAGFFLDELYSLHFEEYKYYCKILHNLEGNPCINPSMVQDLQELKTVKKNLLLCFANQQLRGHILSQLPYKPL